MKDRPISQHGIVGFPPDFAILPGEPFKVYLEPASVFISPKDPVWEPGDKAYWPGAQAPDGWEIAKDVPQPSNGTILRKL